jgi:hypothetical protein
MELDMQYIDNWSLWLDIKYSLKRFLLCSKALAQNEPYHLPATSYDLSAISYDLSAISYIAILP